MKSVLRPANGDIAAELYKVLTDRSQRTTSTVLLGDRKKAGLAVFWGLPCFYQ